mgnify:CR=1 FL=1|tara:strand:+ start:22 stop:288 length:267 start_codon:yes stop_codon:yes gene_type:complete
MLAFLKFLCWFLFIYYLVKVLVRILAPILLRNITIKMQDRFKDQFHKQYTRSEDTVQKEGKITIEKTNNSRKQSKDIGDYVDFEEIED